MKFSRKSTEQQLSALNRAAVEGKSLPFSKKPAAPIIHLPDEFDWGLAVNPAGGRGHSDRSGLNLVVSSTYEKVCRIKCKITFSFSDALLAKLRWRIGDKAVVGFSCRDKGTLVGIKLDPNGRVISLQSGSTKGVKRKNEAKNGILSIPYLDTLPILPVKYTRLEEADFDFSTSGIFVFIYPQNAEVNAG